MTNHLSKLFKEEVPKAIRDQYKELCASFVGSVSKEEEVKIDEAFIVAWEAHKGSFRKSGELYITHPLNVTRIVKDLDLGTTSIISALLYNVIEDAKVSVEEIVKMFGERVATILTGLSELDIKFFWYESKQTESFQKLLKTLQKDELIIILKLADRLANMRSISFLPKTKQWRIASETDGFYVPIAHRFGLNKIKAELEDLSLKVMKPEIYHGIAVKRDSRFRTYEKEIKEFLRPVEEEMKRDGITFRTQTRIKSIASIYRKLKSKKISFSEVYDLMAVRIIIDCPKTKEKSSCWQTYGIVTSHYRLNNRRTKDWISNPRPNGYESLHLTVLNKQEEWVEVQIRSERMHKIASRGIAAHWRYKEKGKEPNVLLEGFDKWLKEMAHLGELDSNGLETIERLKFGFYRREVRVFSEEGKAVVLPSGSTLLDFSIEEYDEQGLYCSYGRVNKRVVPFDYLLKDGDEVILDLDPSKKPDERSLEVVVTPKACKVLGTFFKNKHEKAMMIAKKELAEKFSKHGISFNAGTLERFRKYIEKRSTDSLLLHLINGYIPHIDLMIEKFKKVLDIPIQEEGGANALSANKEEVFYAGMHNKEKYGLAECCSPIPGEDIFGIIHANQIVRIHAMRCKESKRLLCCYAPRIVHVKWKNAPPVEVELYIQAVKYDTFTQNILDAIQGFDVQSFLMDKTLENKVKVSVHVLVQNVAELNSITRKVSAVEGVQEVVKS